jgi:hypothetical protein
MNIADSVTLSTTSILSYMRITYPLHISWERAGAETPKEQAIA